MALSAAAKVSDCPPSTETYEMCVELEQKIYSCPILPIKEVGQLYNLYRSHAWSVCMGDCTNYFAVSMKMLSYIQTLKFISQSNVINNVTLATQVIFKT